MEGERLAITIKKTEDCVGTTWLLLLFIIVVPAATVVIVVILFLVGSYTMYGDLRSGWLRLGGYGLIAEEYTLDLGTVPTGESKPGVFRLRNLTGKPVAILGVKSDCSCLVASALPVTISPREVLNFEVIFLADHVDSKTEVIRQMILHTSVDQPIQILEVKVTIIPNNKES
jgi:hypothetical protein